METIAFFGGILDALGSYRTYEEWKLESG